MSHPTLGFESAAFLAFAGPVLLLSTLLLPKRFVNRFGIGFPKAVAALCLVVFGLASASAVCAGVIPQPASQRLALGGLEIVLHIDALSLTMQVLVAFLALVVTRYSVHYLAGDPRHGEFARWLAVTTGAVLTLVLSGNLLQFTLAWVATSLSLHQLLTFYRHGSQVVIAAQKKFLISRLGDACMVGALILTWRCFGSWDFSEMFAQSEALRALGAQVPALGWTCVLLVAGALLKSAQFPFHSWLPETMDTPTPVSALMHAGIINAGGFLVLRLSPIIASSQAALNGLAVVGAFTALFGSLVMLTQTSVKRSLAYSTVAQMGFMMLECGLGAFGLAVLHIVAHSLYKAHAFLSSGTVVELSRARWVPKDRASAQPLVLIATLAVALSITLGSAWLFGVTLKSEPGVLLLGSVFTMAVAYSLWNLWASSHRNSLLGWGLGMTGGAALSYFALHTLFEKWFADCLPHYAPPREGWEILGMVLVALLFLGLIVLQTRLPAWSSSRLGRLFYVHASHGFYVGTLARRVLQILNQKVTA
jgi:NAD(P)H-quinone oxidoreductase subunit 5